MKNLSHNHEALKEYYGCVLSGTGDLKTNACCSEPTTMPLPGRDILKLIDREITDRFYGCGSPIPESLEGCTMLDLGCGTGRDTYILSDICEDYGQVAVYNGTVSGYPHCFQLDGHHCFITGKPATVCGNTAAMLQDTRLGAHFTIHGSRNVHSRRANAFLSQKNG